MPSLQHGPGAPLLSPFPRYLVRYTPRAISELDCLRSSRLLGLLTVAERTRAEALQLREEVEALLFRRIGEMLKGPDRYQLLRVRRRLHQEKPLRREEVGLLTSDPDCSTRWEAYTAASRHWTCAAHAFRLGYDRELRRSLLEIRRLSRVSPTPGALALASPTLSEALAAARLRDETPELDKLHVSLARYVYRACTKTSPFSAFTVVSEGLTDAAGLRRPPTFELRRGPKGARRVALTGYLQEAVWEHAASSTDLRPHIACVLNPTIIKEGASVAWYFTVGSNGVTRRMVAPEWLCDLIQRLSGGPTTVHRVHEALGEVADLDSAASEVVATQLLRAGFLVLEPPASALDHDWSRRMASWFGDLAGAEPIAELLDRLEGMAECIRVGGAWERVDLLTESEAIVVETLGEAQLRTFFDPILPPGRRDLPTVGARSDGRLGRGSLFYEDVRGERTLDVPEEALRSLCTSLDSLAEHCVLLNPTVTARKGFVRLARRRFGEGARVPLMQLFHEVQRYRHAAAEAGDSGDDQAWQFPEGKEVLSEQVQRSTAWSHDIAEAAAQAGGLDRLDRVYLRLQDLEAGAHHLKGWWHRPNAVSRGATVQVGRAEDGSWSWVMHAPVVQRGHGGLFSRFLPILSEGFTEELRDWNRGLPYGEFLVENTDGSRFNGNAHPRLVEVDIAMPNGNHRRHGAAALPLSEIDLCLLDDDAFLMERGTDRMVVPCHLGFQVKGRDAAFELLDAFSPDGIVYMQALLEKVNAKWRSLHGRDGTEAPRITYGDSLVVQRRRWNLSPEMIERAATLSAPEWFATLHRWSRARTLPEVVFYRVPARKTIAQRRFRKPQYLAFDDPLACEMFRNVAANSEGAELRLEEALPRAEALPRTPAGHHSTEISVSWYVQ